MAVSHIPFDTGTQFGSALNSALREQERSLDRLKELHGTLTLMIDGDGSQASHFAYMQTKLGTPDSATAKAVYDEMASCLAKLSTNAQVTDVANALSQMANKLRQGG